MRQNFYDSYTNDLVERNLNVMKKQLCTVLIEIIRKKGWNQTQVAEAFQVSQPRISNLYNGHLDKFSIDKMLDMLMRCGYSLEADCNLVNEGLPLVINLSKSDLL
jgi:predicted XRE-type DNA-binding protein